MLNAECSAYDPETLGGDCGNLGAFTADPSRDEGWAVIAVFMFQGS